MKTGTQLFGGVALAALMAGTASADVVKIGVLAPLTSPADFLIVDRAGEGANLEEYRLPEPIIVEPGI